MPVSGRCLIIRGGQALLIPASLATPQELAAGIDDVEELCARAARTYLKRRQVPYLDDDTYADLISYLMLVAWTEAVKFSGGGRLDKFIGQRLQWRCTDWYRSRFGRGRHPRPVVISLDEIRTAELLEPDCA